MGAPISARSLKNGTEAFTFRAATALPGTRVDLLAGIQFMKNGRFEVRGEHNVQLGKDFESQAATLRLSWQF
ncbi:hypothetical protein [Chachezhania sediminis]|uniref:hypothetical protein n=1 Tax=Chachezhania sediminis TaxID=2599291 RepID=UPI00131D8C51|nr:hypothetical protein [Chachezhania sediminis]